MISNSQKLLITSISLVVYHEIRNKCKASEIECSTKSLHLRGFSWQNVNYKKDLKLAVPKSLWYSLSTSNTFCSHCKLYNKPLEINVLIFQTDRVYGEVKSKLVRWISFTLCQRLSWKNRIPLESFVMFRCQRMTPERGKF